MKDAESDSDEETRSMINFNKDLHYINAHDKKPNIWDIPKLNYDLPVSMHEREILESVENNLVTIICGETGSGKST